MKEYPTLTALMAGREPGSVKALSALKRERGRSDDWFRPGRLAADSDGLWYGMAHTGRETIALDSEGPWLLVSEDATAPKCEHPAPRRVHGVRAHDMTFAECEWCLDCGAKE